MTDRSADRDLRVVFDRLREEDRGRAPDFRAAWSRARRLAGARRPLPRSRRWAAVGCIAGAAALAVLLARLRPAPAGSSVAEAIVLAERLSSWEAPTDELLEVYRSGFLETVPTLDFDFMDLPAAASDEDALPVGPVGR